MVCYSFEKIIRLISLLEEYFAYVKIKGISFKFQKKKNKKKREILRGVELPTRTPRLTFCLQFSKCDSLCLAGSKVNRMCEGLAVMQFDLVYSKLRHLEILITGFSWHRMRD